MPRSILFLAAIALLSWHLLPAASLKADDKDWVGKKVVPKHRDFTLRSSGDDADRKGRPGV